MGTILRFPGKAFRAEETTRLVITAHPQNYGPAYLIPSHRNT
jgi:hypothetical protein